MFRQAQRYAHAHQCRADTGQEGPSIAGIVPEQPACQRHSHRSDVIHRHAHTERSGVLVLRCDPVHVGGLCHREREEDVIQYKQRVQEVAVLDETVPAEEQRHGRVVEGQRLAFAHAVDQAPDAGRQEPAQHLHQQPQFQHQLQRRLVLLDQQIAREGDADLFSPAFQEGEQIIEPVSFSEDQAWAGGLRFAGNAQTRHGSHEGRAARQQIQRSYLGKANVDQTQSDGETHSRADRACRLHLSEPISGTTGLRQCQRHRGRQRHPYMKALTPHQTGDDQPGEIGDDVVGAQAGSE